MLEKRKDITSFTHVMDKNFSIRLRRKLPPPPRKNLWVFADVHHVCAPMPKRNRLKQALARIAQIALYRVRVAGTVHRSGWGVIASQRIRQSE